MFKTQNKQNQKMNKSDVRISKKLKKTQLRRAIMTPDEIRLHRKRVSFKLQEKSFIAEVNALEECRAMFRKEVILLGQEVIKFREMCAKEIESYRIKVHLSKLQNKQLKQEDCVDEPPKPTEDESSRNKKETENENSIDPTVVTKLWQDKLNTLQDDMELLAKRQSQLDREGALLEKEERLFERKTELEQYEKEIEEIEAGLDRRQEMCQKRQNDLLALEEELDKLKIETEDKKENLNLLGVQSKDRKTRAQENWEQVRNSLLEKQSFLQNKVDQYRTDLATLKSTCTAKDISLQKLQSQIKDLEEEIKQKDLKIDQLDTQLSLMLESEAKSRTLTRNNSTTSRKLKKQNSMRKDSIDNDTIEPLPDFKGKTLRHPMRQSIDLGNPNTRFQMGIKPPSSEDSRACIVM